MVVVQIGGSSRMLFSVIIPVYNGERYLLDCLHSVDSQTFSDFELIVVDDGSSDNSGSIADEYAKERTNVHVLHGPNRGLLLARREGLRHCSGAYVVFLDADDMLRSDALAKISESIGKTSADVVSFRFSRMRDYSVADDLPYIEFGYYCGREYDTIKRAICSSGSNNLWGKAIRFCCIDVEADYSRYSGLMLGEDLLQLLPIIESAKSFVRIEDIIYYYRLNEGGSTTYFKHGYISDTERVACRLLSYGERWGMSAEAANGVLRLYASLGKMLADSIDANMSVDEATDELKKIRNSLRGLSLPSSYSASLRIDQRMIIKALISDSLSMLRVLTLMSHLGRKLLRRRK